MKRETTIPRKSSTASKWSSDLLRKHGGKTVEESKAAEDKEDESDGATDSEAELLRKMMERRRQEVGE